MADRGVCIGPPPPAQSYLLPDNLIMAAVNTGCDAIHPGVGFLSENAAFAGLVREKGLLFIGPGTDTIRLLGDKVEARRTARRFGLPVTPGPEDAVADPVEAAAAAGEIGFPVIHKAAAGGGGKGIRIVRSPEDLGENIAVAAGEAKAAFGDSRLFMERYIENPRHVEVQIIADGRGKVAVLGERDCSVQKNNQKLIEESPSPGVSGEMRELMVRGAAAMFGELRYQGAGTVEFLVEGKDFYFMEVNARVQVEHPVSEYVTGTDIIRQQILACTENRIELEGGTLPVRGWAIECRINALGPGKVVRLDVPGGPGVRFDSFLYTGCTVSPHYDSMVAKLIVQGENRGRALARMDRALGELSIEGIETDREQQRRIINHGIFRSGDFGTSCYNAIAGETEHGLRR
jgi:acetyl-CoA carboxylase biotin carboxylase subunit